MPLQRADDAYDASDEFEGILFTMTDGKQRIVYRVSYEALQDRAFADGDATLDEIATFLRHRTKIEEIASRKFDANDPDRIIRSTELTPWTCAFSPSDAATGVNQRATTMVA